MQQPERFNGREPKQFSGQRWWMGVWGWNLHSPAAEGKGICGRNSQRLAIFEIL